MKNKKNSRLCRSVWLFTGFILISLNLFCFTGWKSLKTDAFIVYHQHGWEAEALNVLQTLEHHRPYVEELTGNSRKRFPVIIEDMGNIVNGFANPIGDRINLFSYFPTGSTLDFVEDWWTLVGVHEYIHILQMTNEGGVPQVLRKAFGNFLYTNVLHPMWMIEGITVFGESAIHPYSGRMNGGNYPAIVSTLAKTNSLPSPSKASYFSNDYPAGNYYVYGGSFFRYLAEVYGQEKFSELYTLNGRRPGAWLSPIFPSLGIDHSVHKVYGKNLHYLWDEWQKYEENKPFVLPENYLTQDGWIKSDLRLYGRELFYRSFSLVKTGAGSNFREYAIKAYNVESNTVRTIHTQAGEYPAGYQIQDYQTGDNSSPYLYFTRNEYRRGFANTTSSGLGAVPQLWFLDLTTGRTKKLYDGSFRAFLVLDNGDILISRDRKNNEGSDLYLLQEGKQEELLFSSEYLIHRFAAYEGKVFVNARKYWRNTSIFELELNQGILLPVIDTPQVESIVAGSNGKIIFTANYDDYLRAYQVDIQTREVELLQGASYMTWASVDDEKVYFLSLSEQGYDIAETGFSPVAFEVPDFPENPAPFPQIMLSAAGDNDSAEISNEEHYFTQDGSVIKKGGYFGNLKHLLLPRIYRYPVIEYDEDIFRVSYLVAGNDAIGHFPYWSALLRYDVHEEEFNYELTLQNRLFQPVKHNLFYTDIDNQTLISDQYIDLVTRMNYGISNIRTGLEITVKDEYERKTMKPYLGLSLRGKGWELANRFSFLYESQEKQMYLTSDRNRSGYHLQQLWRNRLPFESEFELKTFLAYDPDAAKDEVFDALRGYSAGIEANEGIALQSSFSRILVRIREGNWNPHIYIEDIGITLFADTALPTRNIKDEMHYSYGLELKAETHFGFFLPVHTGLRFSYNCEKDFKVGFFVFSNLY